MDSMACSTLDFMVFSTRSVHRPGGAHVGFSSLWRVSWPRRRRSEPGRVLTVASCFSLASVPGGDLASSLGSRSAKSEARSFVAPFQWSTACPKRFSGSLRPLPPSAFAGDRAARSGRSAQRIGVQRGTPPRPKPREFDPLLFAQPHRHRRAHRAKAHQGHRWTRRASGWSWRCSLRGARSVDWRGASRGVAPSRPSRSWSERTRARQS